MPMVKKLQLETSGVEEVKLTMPRIQRGVSLADQAYEIVKNMIINNGVHPGQVLTESQLAKNLFISRSPLREALAKLQHEGFIQIDRWKGIRVAPLDADTIREVYELRLVLECLAARKAAPLIPEQEIDEVEKALQGVRSSLEQGDTHQYVKLDPDLHGLYIRRCGNRLVLEAIYRLMDQVDRIRSFSGSMQVDFFGGYQEHWEMLRAMRAKDPDALEQAVKTHISNSAARLAGRIEESESRAL